MKIVAFGGGGFIGSAIVDRLLLAGHEVRIFERTRVLPYRTFGESEPVEWTTGDMQSPHDVATALEGMDAVLHLVSTTLPKNSNEDTVFDVQSNLVSTLHLLDAMVVLQIKRIVFISSGGTVYGEPRYLPIDEEHPTNPLVSYGITKLAIEKYLLLYQRVHGLKPTILRVANPYGERQRAETAQGAVGVFLHRALRGQMIDIWGDGSAIRDYIYIGDVADAFVRAFAYDGNSTTFNISSCTGVSLNDLLSRLERHLGHAVDRRYLPGRPFDVPASILDNTLARTELGWKPETSLREGIALTAAWISTSMKDNPATIDRLA
ncbi:MAG TPA: NAD-dependent epimerase/dehydratase family protein [bacterium]|nr:NAD-dependent epimerase/dehydratase family protein [bacterium]